MLLFRTAGLFRLLSVSASSGRVLAPFLAHFCYSLPKVPGDNDFVQDVRCKSSLHARGEACDCQDNSAPRESLLQAHGQHDNFSK